ncbi:MAG: hypothetical protein KUF72_01660 [Candidatus Thiodiazotropha sp. (ex Ctena orbiculata)]|nr:hypothetical protein [Candidatus Thiodiazotropha taylori]
MEIGKYWSANYERSKLIVKRGSELEVIKLSEFNQNRRYAKLYRMQLAQADEQTWRPIDQPLAQ